eukprot:TRINITY_DN59728_c0_g1_i1.p1 TRINITY_DN59728_c0_g1~~TRINITY_DN59728_c0_g1_i1.p1  ORF type:complete len:661 (-),score=102.54 TRINITY_DN59728_c0_g1_i1:516-2222(-)
MSPEEVQTVRSSLPPAEDWILEAGDVEDVEKEWVIIVSRGVVKESRIHEVTQPVLDRLRPLIKTLYDCPDCTVCSSLVRRYDGYQRDPPHFDQNGYITVVLALSGADEFIGPGLYVQTRNYSDTRTVRLAAGDVVMHQWDLQHGVSISDGSRLSWILWFSDTANCQKDAERWYGQHWRDSKDPTAAALLSQAHQGSEQGRALAQYSADAGSPYSMFNLAVYHAHGHGGLAQNASAAIALWNQAATFGSGQASVALAVHHRSGDGVEKNLTLAEEWARKAAEPPSENAHGQQLLAEMLLDRGALEEATAWMVRAADQGVPEARRQALQLLAEAGNPTNVAAPKFLVRSARKGDTSAMIMLGINYAGNTANATDVKVGWYERAAARGNAVAAENLGKIYYAGEGQLQANSTRALEWFEIAADGGLVEAMYAAGQLLLDCSRDLPADSTCGVPSASCASRAEQCLRSAAAQGSAKAMTALAELYNEDLPCFGKADQSKAGSFAKQAADAGDPDGMWFWAQMTEEGGYGAGTPDLVVSKHFTKAAAEAGHPEAEAAVQAGGLPSSLASHEDL